MITPFRAASAAPVPLVAHRKSGRALRTVAAIVAATAVLAVAGCSSQDGLADSQSNGTDSTSVDQRIVEIPAQERGEPVVFDGVDERGKSVSSDDFTGEVYVVNFWYAACGPCRVEAPLLEEVRQAYQAEGVEFIGVNTYDQPATALAFAVDYGITYPSVIDIVDGKTKLAFAAVTPIQATPTTLVMDRRGRVAARIIGQLPAASILSTLVADAMAETRVSAEGLIFDGALWVAVLIAVLAGLISFVSPCVLPLVPGYFGYLGSSISPAQRPAAARRRLLGGVALFVAGFTLVFMTVTVLGGVAGLFFIEYANILTRVLGVVVVVMGMVFIGAFPRAQRTLKPRFRGSLGLLSAPLLGVALGIGWTPCIGPTLAAIMSVSWNLGDPGRAALLGLAYSLGLGIPFFLLALGLGWATRSLTFLRRHIRVVNIIGGSILIALGVLMATGIWGVLMSLLQGVMLSVTLPL